MKNKITLLIITILPTLISCTENLPIWQNSTQNIAAYIKFDIPGNEHNLLPDKELIESLVKDDSLQYTITIVNGGLEPRDGMMHLVGTFY